MNLPSQSLEIYQLRIWLKYISPMIWRRLLVKNSDSLLDLHNYIQITMGWEEFHLHQFIIRGIHSSEEKALSDFQFHTNERFIYEYNFFVPWEHEVRVEKKCSVYSNKLYPICIGGSRMSPPEDCDSAHNFMLLEDYCEPINMIFTLKEAAEECEEEDEYAEEHLEEIVSKLKEWQDRPSFNRGAINKQLQKYAYR